MPDASGRGNPFKLLTASVVGILLSFGLCAAGPPWDSKGTPVQIAAVWASLIVFLLSVCGFLTVVTQLLVRAIRKDHDEP